MFRDTNPRVSIIILNWNGLEDTIECLESLRNITYQNYEAIVVDNGSAGEDVAVLRLKFWEYIHLIENDRNYGFCEGNNIGIRYALKNETDYVLLLNNDTIVAPDFLSQLLGVAESNPDIGLLGPKIYFYFEPNRIWFAGGRISFASIHSARGRWDIDRGQFDKIDRVDFVSGSCMLVKACVLKSVGLLDPVYFFGLEDVDLSLRATRAGFSNVFVPSSRIWHKSGKSAARNPDVPYFTSRNEIILARKHYRFSRKAAIRAVTAAITDLLTVSMRYRNTSTVIAMLKGLREGMRVHITSSEAG